MYYYNYFLFLNYINDFEELINFMKIINCNKLDLNEIINNFIDLMRLFELIIYNKYILNYDIQFFGSKVYYFMEKYNIDIKTLIDKIKLIIECNVEKLYNEEFINKRSLIFYFINNFNNKENRKFLRNKLFEIYKNNIDFYDKKYILQKNKKIKEMIANIGMIKFKFGKYKEKMINEVPKDYLNWFIKNCKNNFMFNDIETFL